MKVVIGSGLSLKAKLLGTILGPTVLALLIAFAVVIRNDIATFRQEMVDQTLVIASVVSGYSVSELVFEDPVEANRTLAKLESIPDLEAAVLFDTGNHLFASFLREPGQPTEPPFRHQGFILDGDVLHVVQSIVVTDERSGTLYIRASTRTLQGKIRAYLRGVLLLLAGLIAVSALAAIRLQGVVSRPILALASAARRVSEHADYSTRVEKTGQDEVGALCEAWNEMLEQIERRQDEQERAEEALRRSEERFRSLIENSNDAIYVYSAKGRFLYVNPQFEASFGYPRSEVTAVGFDSRTLVEGASLNLITRRREIDASGAVPPQQFELQGLSKDGETADFEVNTTEIDWDGEPARMGILRDITSRKRAEEQLAYSAFYDDLTGLPNRDLFTDRLRHAIERAKRHEDYRFAVLFLDLDRFKLINDSLGHLFGDTFLCAVAARLKNDRRAEDTVARFGGDEFALLMEDPDDLSEVSHYAGRVLGAFGPPFEVGERQVFSSVSIGIAVSDSSYDTPEAMLRDADTAMYRAKAGGGGRFQVFDTEMHAHAMATLQLETELRFALERGQFGLHYQPIIDLRKGALAGFEALVRWYHPARGLLEPDAFMAVAEETGIVLAIDDWVLRRACRQLRAWTEVIGAVKVNLSVNFSSQHFVRRDLLTDFRSALTEASLSHGGSLMLEITETAIMEHLEAASQLLKDVRPLGIRVSIDDFGTGYSSLSYLRTLPIDRLKIDRSFVRHVLTTREDLAIVRAIIALARTLGLQVVAEGIETREQCERVISLGCDFGQGFWFSRPVPADEATRMLLEDREWLARLAVP